MRPAVALVFILATTSLPAAAKPPKEKKTQTLTDEESFKALDKDGDSLLSKEEFYAGAMNPPDEKNAKRKKSQPASDEQFDKLDADKDGKLTLEEFSKREPAPSANDRRKKRKDAE